MNNALTYEEVHESRADSSSSTRTRARLVGVPRQFVERAETKKRVKLEK